MSSHPPDPMPGPFAEEYTVGWVCALPEEYQAACRMRDHKFQGPETCAINDNNTYAFGSIGGHFVVIACLPDGQYGNSPAATVAQDMVRSFTKLRFALMVGIGGGAPTEGRDIRLGDVVVSRPQGTLGGVVKYDLGKLLSDDRFVRTGQLDNPPKLLLGALPEMQRRQIDPEEPDGVKANLERMKDIPEFRRPTTEDRLYRANYEHVGGASCESCKADGLKRRPQRERSRAVMVHYGIIASGDTLMRNAKKRDKCAIDPELNVLCFEMEAGGVMNNFPCLVIRGICDYSDSHKNDEWHNYAALTAAAYARELLHVVKPPRVAKEPPWAGKMESMLRDIRAEQSAGFVKVDQLLQHQHSQEEQAILKWLTPIDYGNEQASFLRERQNGTGQWLLDSQGFQTWMETDKKTIFCPGIPGAGKTILTSIVADHLCTRFRGYGTVGISYIYCNFQRRAEQDLDSLLASLVKQLSPSPLPTCVLELYHQQKQRKTRPSCEEIWRALELVTQEYSKVFIIVDALDECQNSDSCRAKFISRLFDLQLSCPVNIFATSRFLLEITQKFDRRMTVEIRARKDDVIRFLEGHIGELPSCVQENRQLQEEIVTGIAEAVDGMEVSFGANLPLLA